MKRLPCTAVVVLGTLLSCMGQINFPLGSHGSSGDTNKKSTRITSRTLTGTVLDKGDHPITGAVVYLKNKKTLAVKSFFSLKDGTYRFPELSTNVDYEVYAEKDGKKSAGKTLSEFDDRASPVINLRIDTSG